MCYKGTALYKYIDSFAELIRGFVLAFHISVNIFFSVIYNGQIFYHFAPNTFQ